MFDLEKLKEFFQKEQEEILDDFLTFLRFKTIATDPAFSQDVVACADWLCQYLEKIGLEVEKWDTAGAPIVFAQTAKQDPKKETLLLYCHYDVQPVDPLGLWTHPPFEPKVDNGTIYARGASDDKGQCFYTIRALKTLLEQRASLPVNIKFLIEGEEESGSTQLRIAAEKKREELRADHVLIIDSGFFEKNKPVIGCGVRGMAGLTVRLTGSSSDLHSGLYGGIVYNPNRALVELLASLHDASGCVTVAGFYDDVVEMPPSEKKLYSLSFNLKLLEEHYNFKATGMEQGMTPLEAAWLRPTLEINGISGGYAGEGFKTVIPAQATAKISCRLVPRQDPDTILNLIKNHLFSRLPDGLSMDIEFVPGKGAPYQASPHSKIAQTMVEAYTHVFQNPCQRILNGGSIPISATLAHITGGALVFIGLGLPEDQLHAPNERFDIERLQQGYLSICRGIELFDSFGYNHGH